MQLFSADTIVFSKKKIKFFDPENLKKLPSKVAHKRPPTAQTAQKQKSCINSNYLLYSREQ